MFLFRLIYLLCYYCVWLGVCFILFVFNDNVIVIWFICYRSVIVVLNIYLNLGEIKYIVK